MLGLSVILHRVSKTSPTFLTVT